jgi:hypothetical protein
VRDDGGVREAATAAMSRFRRTALGGSTVATARFFVTGAGVGGFAAVRAAGGSGFPGVCVFRGQ